jgi:hypothetical protein
MQYHSLGPFAALFSAYRKAGGRTKHLSKVAEVKSRER